MYSFSSVASPQTSVEDHWSATWMPFCRDDRRVTAYCPFLIGTCSFHIFNLPATNSIFIFTGLALRCQFKIAFCAKDNLLMENSHFSFLTLKSTGVVHCWTKSIYWSNAMPSTGNKFKDHYNTTHSLQIAYTLNFCFTFSKTHYKVLFCECLSDIHLSDRHMAEVLEGPVC